LNKFIYCEIVCNNCGGISANSGYYSPERIKKLKEEIKSGMWIYSGNNIYCKECYEKIKTK